ncbi:MAG: isochorismatase family protein [Bacteriovoracaceae bacterium]|nr:isochorismatase family protein [Bacteriovoracaceae bacterium]
MWKKLTPENVLFLLIDYQQSFFKILKKSIVKDAHKNILLLIEMFKKLEVPMIGTEHYKKGLGDTDSEVLKAWGDAPVFTDKITFSCCGDEQFQQNLKNNSRPIVVVTGLETQICVLQTTLDLLDQGYIVIVLKDAVLSTTKLKWENGLELMRQAGAHILNTETLLFHLLKRADTPEFKHMVKQLKKMQ